MYQKVSLVKFFFLCAYACSCLVSFPVVSEYIRTWFCRPFRPFLLQFLLVLSNVYIRLQFFFPLYCAIFIVVLFWLWGHFAVATRCRSCALSTLCNLKFVDPMHIEIWRPHATFLSNLIYRILNLRTNSNDVRYLP